MNKIYALLLALVSIGLYSCEDEFGVEEIEVTYDTIPFDRIKLETSSHVRIIQSNDFKVSVRGLERDVNDTEVSVHNDRLVITEHGHIDNDQVIKIYVPEISQLESVGSSLVYGESEFVQNRSMDIDLTGSGEIDMYVDVDNLDVELTGSGYVYLEGYADNVDAEVTGSGWLRAFGMVVDVMDLRIEGSGSGEVYVEDDLDVIITGSGNVFYKGHPSLDVEITGSGKVIDSN
jgi:hypothetical protein